MKLLLGDIIIQNNYLTVVGFILFILFIFLYILSPILWLFWRLKKLTKGLQKLSRFETLKHLTEYYKLSFLVSSFCFTLFMTVFLLGIFEFNRRILETISEVNYIITKLIDANSHQSVLAQICTFMIEKEMNMSCLSLLEEFVLVGTGLVTLNITALLVIAIDIFLMYMIVIKLQSKYKKGKT